MTLRDRTIDKGNRAALWLPGYLLASVLTVAAAPFAFAQNGPKTTPGAAAESAKSEPYVDRVLDQGSFKDDGLDAQVDTYNASGWPRNFRVDYSLLSQSGVGSGLQQALSISGFIDTPNYGAISGLANFVSNRSDSRDGFSTSANSNIWRIDQRALPLDGGWIANHSVGTTSTFGVPLARGIGRVFLPTTPIQGLSGQWQRRDGLELNASAGRIGLYSGFAVNGFNQSGGDVLTAGGQTRLLGDVASASRLDAAVQVIEARNVPTGGVAFSNSGAATLRAGPTENTRGLWTSLAWEGAAPWGNGVEPGKYALQERRGGLRVQLNAMQSSSSLKGNALGTWLDAAWRSGWLQNTAGVFYFDPELRWGALTQAGDLRGVYWRAETSSRQWSLGWSTELSDSVSGLYGGSFFGSVYGRYRLDTRNSVGSTLSLRTGSGAGQGVQVTWDRLGDWGRTQWRADYTRLNGGRATAARAAVDQSWLVGEGNSFTTSLGYERRSEGTVDPIYGPIPAYSAWTWGLLGSYTLYSGVRLDGSVRGAQGNSISALNANVGATWQINRNWALAARYTESRGRDPLSPVLVSALTSASQTVLAPTPASRAFQLVLRWEDSAGTARAPIGGPPGSGAGRLTGTVFLDADNNGRRDASEVGVQGVGVVLDRRYLVRTDAQGRYEFPAVAAGEHLIEVQPDNVPLPWSPIERDPVQTRIYVRDTTTRDFGMQRER